VIGTAIGSYGAIQVSPESGDVFHLTAEGQELLAVPYNGAPTIEPFTCASHSVTGSAGNFEPFFWPGESIYGGEAGGETQGGPISALANGRFEINEGRPEAPGYLYVVLGRRENLNSTDTLVTTGERGVDYPCPTSEPTNRAPTAHKDYGHSTGLPTSGNVLANDTDPDGDALTLISNTQGAVGKVTCSSSGDCTYTPGSKYQGNDSFSYTISDGRGGTSSARDFIRAKPLPAGQTFVLKQVHLDLGLTNGDFRLRHDLHLTSVTFSFVLGKNGVKKLAEAYDDNSFTDAEVSGAVGGIACSALTPAAAFACGVAATTASEVLKSRIEAAAANPQCLRLTLTAHFTPHVSFFHGLPVHLSDAPITPSFHTFSGKDDETGLSCENHF
jgi:Bacterial Ig domain